MPVERTTGGTSLIDVLDRVLDKGIVIDAWVRVSLVGIDLITVEARVVVASIDTYLKYSEAVGSVPSVAKPALSACDGRSHRGVARRERVAPRAARRGRPQRRPAAVAASSAQDDVAHAVRRTTAPPSAVGRARASRGAAHLELLEALLVAGTAAQCGQRTLAWLQRRAGLRRGVCLAAHAGTGPRLVPVASVGRAGRADRGLQRRSRGARAPVDAGAAGRRAHDDRPQRQPRPGHPAGAGATSWPSPLAPLHPRDLPAGLLLASPPTPALLRRRALAGPRRGATDGRAHSRRCGSRSPSAAAARAGPAVEHHQRGHRSDLAHRRRGPDHHRQRAGRGAARHRRRPERGAPAGGGAQQHALLGRAHSPRHRGRRGAAPRGAAGRSGRRLRPALRAAQHDDLRRSRGHRDRVHPAQRHRPAAGHRRAGGQLPQAARDRGRRPGRARPPRPRHRLGGRPDHRHRPRRQHRHDERAGRAPVHRRRRQQRGGPAHRAGQRRPLLLVRVEPVLRGRRAAAERPHQPGRPGDGRRRCPWRPSPARSCPSTAR